MRKQFSRETIAMIAFQKSNFQKAAFSKKTTLLALSALVALSSLISLPTLASATLIKSRHSKRPAVARYHHGVKPRAVKQVATSAKTQLTWYGHAAFKVVTPKGHTLYFDPWLQNPSNPNGKKELADLTQADLLFVSHGHFDHVGDAVAIAQKTKARLVTTYDLGNALVAHTGFPKDHMGFDSQGNLGGSLQFFDGEVTVTFVPAFHGSTVTGTDEQPYYGGNPSGFLVSIAHGPTIYHTGDTDFFSDMALIPQKHPVDVMLTCIGDHFTMGPDLAAKAVAAVHPTRVVAMHYGTFPVLTGTVMKFKSALLRQHGEKALLPMSVGQTIEF
jgi:L-ascorbate metabolism protein UlaG (beta-lactamase superfamily)